MPPGPAPLKVLISAYACVPGEGSEPGTGWEWTRAAALGHDVWLLTESVNLDRVRAAIAAEPELTITVIEVVTPPDVAWQPGGGAAERVRYAKWQKHSGAVAIRLHREIGFDVMHHVTLGGDYLPVGLLDVPDVPFVWGPTGGYAPTLWRQLAAMPRRAAAGELARSAVTAAGRGRHGDAAARRASLVLAKNADVAQRFRRSQRVVVEPDVGIRAADLPARVAPPADGSRQAVFAGRLLAWKGPHLAVAALARPEAAGWRLDVYGDGPEEAALRAQVAASRLTDRVRLLGNRPREEVLSALAGAGALIHPSLHDSSGWITAEALSIGCPVLCLDVAGPATMVTSQTGVKVSPHGDVVGGLARGLADIPAVIASQAGRFGVERLPSLIARCYAEAVSGQPVRDSSPAEPAAAQEFDPIELPPLPDRPVVSVLVANYNYERYLATAVRSALNQSETNGDRLDADLEIVVCDDGSKDGSRGILARLAAEDSRIVAVLQDNAGQSAATTAAFDRCRGDIICLLDADDTFGPDKVARLVAAFRANPRAGFAVHRMTIIDVEGSARGVTPARAALPTGWLAETVLSQGGMLSGLPSTSGLTMRRQVAERIFPLPSDAKYSDVVVQTLAPLLTEVAAVDAELGGYRWHGENKTHRFVNFLDTMLRERWRAWGWQQALLGQVNPAAQGRLRAVDENLFAAQLQYVLARVRGDSAAAEHYSTMRTHAEFAAMPVPDRLVWTAAPRLPRRVLAAIIRERFDPSSRLRRMLARVRA